MITGQRLSAAAITGGIIIIVAFAMLSWSTYREMNEEKTKKCVIYIPPNFLVILVDKVKSFAD
jgi:hypothetical protein